MVGTSYTSGGLAASEPVGLNPARRVIRRRDLLDSLMHNPSVLVGGFLLFHMVLAVVMYRVHTVATAHALLTIVIGLWWAMVGRRVERVVYIGGYITGSEVLWRMCHAQIFWETGKYAVSAIFLIAILRSSHLKASTLAIPYFALLLPSTVMAAMNPASVDIRSQTSFNLSGPFALMMSVWFLSRIKLSSEQFRRLLVAILGPIVGIAANTLFSTYTTADITWTHSSNFATSAGFGPNQVASALGLGILIAFFYVLESNIPRYLRLVMIFVALLCAVQSAMTFSREGIYDAVAAAVVAALLVARDSRSRLRLLLLALVAFITITYVALPNLNAFTGGALQARLEDTRLTHRDTIARDDMRVFLSHPVFGVGPGQAKIYRTLDSDTAAHTEFTRLLAEHGIFGLFALCLLFTIAIQYIKRNGPGKGRAVAAALAVWSMLYMVGAAMRLVAPAYIFGLACVYLVPDAAAIAARPGSARMEATVYKRPRALSAAAP